MEVVEVGFKEPMLVEISLVEASRDLVKEKKDLCLYKFISFRNIFPNPCLTLYVFTPCISKLCEPWSSGDSHFISLNSILSQIYIDSPASMQSVNCFVLAPMLQCKHILNSS